MYSPQISDNYQNFIKSCNCRFFQFPQFLDNFKNIWNAWYPLIVMNYSTKLLVKNSCLQTFYSSIHYIVSLAKWYIFGNIWLNYSSLSFVEFSELSLCQNSVQTKESQSCIQSILKKRRSRQNWQCPVCWNTYKMFSLLQRRRQKQPNSREPPIFPTKVDG